MIKMATNVFDMSSIKSLGLFLHFLNLGCIVTPFTKRKWQRRHHASSKPSLQENQQLLIWSLRPWATMQEVWLCYWRDSGRSSETTWLAFHPLPPECVHVIEAILDFPDQMEPSPEYHQVTTINKTQNRRISQEKPASNLWPTKSWDVINLFLF